MCLLSARLAALGKLGTSKVRPSHWAPSHRLGGSSDPPPKSPIPPPLTIQIQAELGLAVDPGAVMISFVGRWAFEKGIDLVAEAVLHVLETYDNVQFYVCGPVGDEAGQFAASRLCALAQVPPLNRKLFVRAEFFRVTEQVVTLPSHHRYITVTLRADFLVLSSRDGADALRGRLHDLPLAHRALWLRGCRAAWSKWPPRRGHSWPPWAHETASEGLGLLYTLGGETHSTSDPTERPRSWSQTPHKSPFSLRLTM